MPVARRTDPSTSWEAANSFSEERVRESQEAIYDVLATYGPMPDKELEALYQDLARQGEVIPQELSGIRSRRNELVKAGRIYQNGRKKKLPNGRRVIIWKAR